MSDETKLQSDSHYIESSGLAQLLRVFSIAGQPSKLGLGLAAIIFTVVWGVGLDGIWTLAGADIAANELTQYVGPQDAVESGPASAGVFSVFSAFELSCLRDAIESVRYGRLIGAVHAGDPVIMPVGIVQEHPVRGAFSNVVLMGRGGVWLITRHYVYCLFFVPVVVLTWALFGGAICRMAALQFAADEPITITEALKFTRQRLFDGFFAAPLLPLILSLLIGLVLLVGGMFLSIPWLGDLVGGLLFFLALIGGAAIALLAVGLVAGGSLFWPTIAVEASDSFDAVARSYSYVYGRPLRAMWYALWLALFGSFAWLLVMFVIWLAAGATHLFVGLGSGIFGDYGGAPNKLAALWAPPTFENLHDLPGRIEGVRYAGAWLIAMWVLLLWGLAWSFLASFYFSGSTIAYYLLRRDVDGTDLGEVVMDERETDGLESAGLGATTHAPTTAPAEPAAAKTDDVSPPPTGPGAPAPADSPSTADKESDAGT